MASGASGPFPGPSRQKSARRTSELNLQGKVDWHDRWVHAPHAMSTPRLWRHIAVSLIAAGPAGGFLFGLLNAGDPDPNPIGRAVYACMMAVRAPLHGGFPPHDGAGPGRTVNVLPHMVIAFLLLISWLVLRGQRASTKRNDPPA